MTIRNVSDAKEQLSSLLAMVEKGEEVVIARAGHPVARLVRYELPVRERRPGALKGKIWLAEDFDSSDSEFEHYFYGGEIEPKS